MNHDHYLSGALQTQPPKPLMALNYEAGQTDQAFNGARCVRPWLVDFDDGSSWRFRAQGYANARMEPAYDFEGLLACILSGFVDLPAGDVEHQIGRVLGRICAFFGLDRAEYWRPSQQDPASFKLTQHWLAPERLLTADLTNGGSQMDLDISAQFTKPHEIPIGTESKCFFPWITSRAMRGEPIAFSNLEELPLEALEDKAALAEFGTRASMVVPLPVRDEVIGIVSFDMLREERYWPELLFRRLKLVAQIFADVTARKLAEEALTRSYAEIKKLKEQLEAESAYLKTEIKVSHAHGQIIGRSPGLKRVLHQVEQVAPADCAVLISGETGTGKELIAQEIHRLSRRRDRIMVLVNCAALPSALVESELFGRERGAYTGALTRQVGRFEVADGSTIFLDEVGELSMEVQAKLLRVLQQGEFQRLGSPKTYNVNVRIIAATNRDLAEEVRKGRFREDLYYRLKVFPIDMPPLRERVEDIPLLVFEFMEEFATRMGKQITKVPHKAMEALQEHSWPGNIRELRNVIEHSVILSAKDTLKLSMLGDAPTREAEPVTLAEAERRHISKTLERTGWRIKGPHGAAQRLGLQPSTLYSRMEKLRILNRRQKDEMATES